VHKDRLPSSIGVSYLAYSIETHSTAYYEKLTIDVNSETRFGSWEVQTEQITDSYETVWEFEKSDPTVQFDFQQTSEAWNQIWIIKRFYHFPLEQTSSKYGVSVRKNWASDRDANPHPFLSLGKEISEIRPVTSHHSIERKVMNWALNCRYGLSSRYWR